MRFVADGLQPQAITPLADLPLQSIAGKLSARGHYDWGRKKGSGMTLRLADLGFAAPWGAVQGINGQIRFNSLHPLTTPPRQRLKVAIARLNPGLDITRIDSRFQLRPNGRITGIDVNGSLAEGKIRLQAPSFTSGAKHQKLTMTADTLNLAPLSAAFKSSGIDAKGHMDGKIPLRIQGEKVYLNNGWIASEKGGVIRYRDPVGTEALASGGESTNLLVKALENFHYKRFRINLDGEAMGEVTLTGSIDGKNPDFYNGYPIVLNLNVQGKLGKILLSELTGFDPTEQLRKIRNKRRR
ncbi:MAG: YdbH domain-containing protein [Magnetococcales bacterium]|nr:YdbH domain-containing protein [Magnetococcales bacterium]